MLSCALVHCYASGASVEAIQLLSKYLEITSDVQSCTLIAIRAFTPKLIQDNQVQVWITRYRGIYFYRKGLSVP